MLPIQSPCVPSQKKERDSGKNLLTKNINIDDFIASIEIQSENAPL